MNLNKDKVVFGIIHTKKVRLNHPYNRTICLHTEYGNLYVQKRSKQEFCNNNQSACFFCCLESIQCSLGVCPTRFVSKYKNVNMKTMKKLVVHEIKFMEEKYPDSDWKEFFEKKIKINLNRNDK